MNTLSQVDSAMIICGQFELPGNTRLLGSLLEWVSPKLNFQDTRFPGSLLVDV